MQRDKPKDKVLEAVGFTVLRFTNNEVLSRMDFVVVEIDEVIL